MFPLPRKARKLLGVPLLATQTIYQYLNWGYLPPVLRPTTSIVVGRSTGGRVESTQSYRVGWNPLIRGQTPWLTLFAVRNSCRA